MILITEVASDYELKLERELKFKLVPVLILLLLTRLVKASREKRMI